jgi:hypothetical protein
VLVSIGEFIMLAVASGGMGVNLSFLRVFRIFRIVRGFKMLRENREFVRILESAIVGLKAMWVFLIVWALLLLIFAILGVQLFGGRGELDSDRLGFRDVGSALLTLFVVSTGENTFEVAYATIQATGSNWAGLYMIVWLIITTAILSLILGILIDAITAENDELEAEETAEGTARDPRGRQRVEGGREGGSRRGTLQDPSGDFGRAPGRSRREAVGVRSAPPDRDSRQGGRRRRASVARGDRGGETRRGVDGGGEGSDPRGEARGAASPRRVQPIPAARRQDERHRVRA